MKGKRHLKIINIVKNERIRTQEELARFLEEEGIEVTQATVSRDIKDLGLIKVPIEDGSYKYAMPPEADKYKMARWIEKMFKNFVLSVETTGNLVVVKTLSGTAGGLASAIDNLEWKEVLGCVAGDDCIFVALKENCDRKEVVHRLRELVGIE